MGKIIFQMLGLINKKYFTLKPEIGRQEATSKQVSHLSHTYALVASALLLMLEVIVNLVSNPYSPQEQGLALSPIDNFIWLWG